MNQSIKQSKQALPKKNRRRQKNKGKRLTPFILAGVLVLCAIAGWWIKAAGFARSIRFDLRSEEVAKGFVPSHVQGLNYTADGIRLSCSEPCYVLSPRIVSTWKEYPFLKAQLNESSAPAAFIFWLADKSNEANGIREVNPKPSSTTQIISANSFRPWNRQMPWNGSIDHVGIRLPSGSVLISEIVLSDSLTPWEWVKFSLSELRSIEPFMAYSINIIWGASINGWSLTTVCGGLAVLALLVALCSRLRRIGQYLAGFAVLLVLIVDLPFVTGLVRTSFEASAMSAWKDSQQEEEASRFGVEFAEIARIVRREVPVGRSIFVPQRNRKGLSLESEPLLFQLWPQYKSAHRIEEADYIILLNPATARYDAQKGGVVIPDQTPVPVEPVAILNSEAMILKRNYDR